MALTPALSFVGRRFRITLRANAPSMPSCARPRAGRPRIVVGYGRVGKVVWRTPQAAMASHTRGRPGCPCGDRDRRDGHDVYTAMPPIRNSRNLRAGRSRRRHCHHPRPRPYRRRSFRGMCARCGPYHHRGREPAMPATRGIFISFGADRPPLPGDDRGEPANCSEAVLVGLGRFPAGPVIRLRSTRSATRSPCPPGRGRAGRPRRHARGQGEDAKVRPQARAPVAAMRSALQRRPPCRESSTSLKLAGSAGAPAHFRQRAQEIGENQFCTEPRLSFDHHALPARRGGSSGDAHGER